MKYILGSLYYLWKLYIGFVFVVTMIFFYPILFVLMYYESLKHLTFKVNIVWSRCMRIFCFYAVEKTGCEKIEGTSFVLVGNHNSYLDIFLLYSILPQHKFLFMGKSELLKYPLVKSFFKRLNIPVDRSSSIKSAKSFIKARREMEKGWSIVVFPEGGMVDPTINLAPFKKGAFQLAKVANRGILPITFLNNYYLFSDPSYFFLPAMPGLVKLHIHDPIKKEEVAKKSIEEISNQAFQTINSLLI